eukprot:scaffold85123_cov21-Phaeocystis_antarctica.AAC.1
MSMYRGTAGDGWPLRRGHCAHILPPTHLRCGTLTLTLTLTLTRALTPTLTLTLTLTSANSSPGVEYCSNPG